jgi:hypothetical protein
MEIAVRPHIAAGVALLGAGVIAVSPMAPPVPDIHLPSVSTAANNLVALTSPLHLGDAYNQVLQAAITNIQGLIQNVADDPTPILNKIIADQSASLSNLAAALQTAGGAAATTLTAQVPALLQTALNQLAASNVSGAVNTLLEIPVAIAAPALNLLPALQQMITQPITNLVNVIQAVTAPLNAPLELVGLVAPLISMTGATGVAIQNVVSALGTGDIQNVANAVLTAPATIADGLLNGGYGPDLGPLVGQPISVFAGGLLSLSTLVFGGPTGVFVKTAGPLGSLLFLRDIIAAALQPPKPATTAAAAAKVKTDPAALPEASAPTIALPAGETPTDTKPTTAPTAGTTPAADPSAAAPSTAPATDTPPAKADDATQTAPAATDPVADKGDEGTTATPAKSDDTTTTAPVKTTKPVDSTPSSTTPATDKGETTGTTPAGSTDTKSGNEAKPTTSGNDAGKSGDGSAAGKSSDNAGGAAKSEGAGEKHDGAKHAAKHGGGK